MKGLRPALRRPQSAGMLSYLLETLPPPNSTFPIDTDQRSHPSPTAGPTDSLPYRRQTYPTGLCKAWPSLDRALAEITSS